jgi:hypothetical protein
MFHQILQTPEPHHRSLIHKNVRSEFVHGSSLLVQFCYKKNGNLFSAFRVEQSVLASLESLLQNVLRNS